MAETPKLNLDNALIIYKRPVVSKIPKQLPEFSGNLDGMLAAVAELYYKDGLTQAEIGRRLGLSRQTIVSYLRQGKKLGIVEIKIKGSAYSGSGLSRSLRAKYKLQDVYISRTASTSLEETKRATARLGALALEGLLENGDIVGVSWGSTVSLASMEMPRGNFPQVEVLLLQGSTAVAEIDSPEASTIRIAWALGAKCKTLHAPAILSTPELASQLRAEPLLQNQLARFDDLDKVFFSVGNVDQNTIIATSGVASTDEMRRLRDAGAKAVLCGHFIDANGAHVGQDFATRTIGANLMQVKGSKTRICVVAGLGKVAAIHSAIAGGYVTHLVIDDALAEALHEYN